MKNKYVWVLLAGTLAQDASWGQQVQSGAPCSAMEAKASLPGGTAFNKQSQQEEVTHFLAVTKDFDNRLIAMLTRFNQVHTRREFDQLNEWTRSHNDLCYFQWATLASVARKHGALSRPFVTPEMLRELSLEDSLWKNLTAIALKWYPDALDDLEP